MFVVTYPVNHKKEDVQQKQIAQQLQIVASIIYCTQIVMTKRKSVVLTSKEANINEPISENNKKNKIQAIA